MRPRISASVALFSLLVLPTVLVSSGNAQARAATASANSAPGGHSFAGVPISPISPASPGAANNSRPSQPYGGFLWRHGRNSIGEAYAVPIPYPNATGEPENEVEAGESDADYQGGPTIFDRRGSGPDSYVPPVTKVPTPHAGVSSAALSVPDVPQEPTLLIFKDGHKVQLENYAIVGANLVDLSPGHQRAIALADLDLGATRQQNDERGVTFHGPHPTPRTN